MASTITTVLLGIFVLITLSNILPINTEGGGIQCYECDTHGSKNPTSDNCFTMKDPSKVKMKECKKGSFLAPEPRCRTQGTVDKSGKGKDFISRFCGWVNPKETNGIGCEANPNSGPDLVICGCETEKCNNKPGLSFNSGPAPTHTSTPKPAAAAAAAPAPTPAPAAAAGPTPAPEAGATPTPAASTAPPAETTPAPA